MGVVPPVRTVYWNMEKAKLERFKKKLEKIAEEVRDEIKEHGLGI